MKNLIIGVYATLILLLSILIIFSVNGRVQRKIELENALNNAMTVALEGTMESKNYAPASNEDLIADFEQAFFMQINSVSDITLNYPDIDYEKGLLSVEAISHFKYLTGNSGSVSVKKSMILDLYEDELSKTAYDVTYMVHGNTYRNYKIHYGKNLWTPPTPEIEGLTFKGWKDDATETLYTEEQLQTVVCDRKMIYIAVFE